MQPPVPKPNCVPFPFSLYCWGHVALTLLQAMVPFFSPRDPPITKRILAFCPGDDIFHRLRDTLDLCVGTRPENAHAITLFRKPAYWLTNNGWTTINPAYSQAMRTTLCAQILYLSDGALVFGKRPATDPEAEARWREDWRVEHAWYETPVPWLFGPLGSVGLHPGPLWCPSRDAPAWGL